MRLEPRGPEAIRGRIAELRSKLAGLKQSTGGTGPLEPPPTPRPSPDAFPNLQGRMPGLPSGRIQNSAFSGAPGLSGNMPLDPMAGGMTLNTLQSAAGREAWIPAVREIAANHGLDPALFESLVEQESAFNPTAVSRAGAQGLTQLMPATAKMLGVSDPFDPIQNLDGGARYLAQMLNQFDGDERLALAAYNAGPGAVKRNGGIPPFTETQNYVAKVMARTAERRAG